MPQLSQAGAIYASQLFWLAIVFGLIYFGIGKAMVPKIERTIDDRNGKISGDLAAAEAAHTAARLSEQDYQSGLESARSQALRTIAEAKAKASSHAEAEVKKGDSAMAENLAAATVRIGQSKQQALAEIETATIDSVQEIIAKLSGVVAERASIEQQVKAELAHG